MKTVILVIDMLNDYFLSGRLKDSREELCSRINELVAWGRERDDVNIIWVRQEFKADLSDAFLVMRRDNISKTIEHTKGSQILDELVRHKADLEIVKKRYSAFFQTKLDDIVRDNNIRQMILCGINTHACIRTAAIDAYQRDLGVIIAADCVDSYDEEHHTMSLNYLGKAISRVMNNEQIKRELQGLAKTQAR